MHLEVFTRWVMIIVNSYPLLLDDCELLNILLIQHHCVPEVGHTMV